MSGILIELLGAHLLVACAPEGKPEKERIPLRCEKEWRASYPKIKPVDGETLTIDPTGKTWNQVIADPAISRKTIDLYLENLPYLQDQVLEFHGIDSIWRDRLTLLLVDVGSPNYFCYDRDSPSLSGCSVPGKMLLNNLGLTDWNEVNRLTAHGRLWNRDILVHELSHALRRELVGFKSKTLEEGAARSAEVVLSRRPGFEEDWKRHPKEEKTPKIFEGEAMVGEPIPALENQDSGRTQIGNIRLIEIKEGEVHIEFDLKWQLFEGDPEPGVPIPFSFPVNTYVELPNMRDQLVLHAVAVEEEKGALIRIFRRRYEIDSEGNAFLVDILGQDTACDEEAFRLPVVIATDEGAITIQKFQRHPYSREAQNVVVLEAEGDNSHYETGFCFFEGLKNQQVFLWEMENFYRLHQEESASFPIVSALMAVNGFSGMGEAFAYMERFGIPLDEEFYTKQGACEAFPVESVEEAK